MSAGRITELRLTSFKSYQDVTLPIDPLTVLIGRNGSGKSNALDSLEVLSRLARGDEVRDAVEGRRGDAGAVRGGLEGCAPVGSDTFSLGVRVELADQRCADLDVTVQVRPTVQIVAESLKGHIAGNWKTLVETVRANPDRADIDATVHNGRRGPDPHRTFRASHLITTQVPLRLAGSTATEKALMALVIDVLAVLGGIFHLDPVPHTMRQYVPEQDVVLRRNADNLSAAVAHLRSTDKDSFTRLLEVVRELPEYDVRALDIGKGGFGEVMLALKERRGRRTATVPARQMSDGMLRMLAIATALLTGGGGLAIEAESQERPGTLMLVIEELENGLHPSQAASLLRLVSAASHEQGFQVMVTTHSPALLNALSGDQHRGVVVIERDRTSGQSSASRLVDLPGYLRLMATSKLGDAVAAGRLVDAAQPTPQIDDDRLDRLLGLLR